MTYFNFDYVKDDESTTMDVLEESFKVAVIPARQFTSLVV